MDEEKFDRLLRAAAQAKDDEPPPIPFGFETRVVALWRAHENQPNGIASLLRRVALLAATVIVVSTVAAVREIRQNRESGESFTNEFAIADSAIQDEFPQ